MAEGKHLEKHEAIDESNKPLDFLAPSMQEAEKEKVFMNDRQILALTISRLVSWKTPKNLPLSHSHDLL